MAIKRLICLIFIFGLVLSTTGVAEVSKKQQSNMRFRPGKRNKVRDISIVQLRIEPTQFKVGDRVHVLVNVANSSEISVNNVSIELKVRGTPIGRKNITTIAPGQIVETDFTCIIGKRKSELIEIAAIIKSAQMEKRPKGKIKKVRYNYVYDAESDVGILYKVEPPVHQWIAFQAYNKLPSADLKSEMSSYLPTSSSDPKYSSSFSPPSGWYSDDDAPYIGSTALIEGAWEEDQGDFDPILGKPWRYVSHFWDPDESYDKGLDLSWWGFGQMPSALEAAQVHFYEAVSNYSSGNKDLAYYYLGRTAHLLMDMSVPAHTLMDVHWPDDDQYEEYTATGTNYKDILSSSTNTNIPDITGLDPYPLYTPSGFNDGLTKLLYNLTELSDNFDSDDSGETQYGISIPYGESYEFGQGKYTLARISLNSSKVFDRAEWWGPWPFGGKERDLYQYGENGPYIDYDIFDGCGEYHMYVYFSLWDELNNTLDRIRVIYTDGSDDFVTNWDDIYDVPDSVLECIYQPRLEAWAIGYVAALYQLFWDSVEHPDTDPPTPSPMTWATEPYQTSTSSISMVATAASDASPPIEYEFDFTSSPTGGSGGSDRSWNTSRTYTDSGLQTNHQYGYRVRARDSAPARNTTGYSSPVRYVYTLANPPSPAPFSNVTKSSIQANWTANGNRSGTQYFCENTTKGTDSGWIPETYWNEAGLDCGNQYCYQVKAKNGDDVNTTPISLGCQTTLTCPVPDIRVSESFYDYNSVVVGSYEDWILTIYNDGSANLSITGFNGLEATDFNLVGPPSLPFTIEPNDSNDLTVRFTPSSAGTKNAILSIANNDPDPNENPIDVNLVGTGVPSVIYVDANSPNEPGSGTPENPYRRIQYGINAAVDGTKVIVALGRYYENINFNGKNIILTSTEPNDPNVVANTVIDGNDFGSVVTFASTEDPNCLLTGFTITNGRGTIIGGERYGGGVYGGGTQATISKCMVAGNTAGTDVDGDGAGGGIYDCDGLIEDCNVSNNTSESRGGGAGLSHCDGTIRYCTISHNVNTSYYDPWGAGLRNCNGTISNCRIFANSGPAVWANGGGVAYCDGTIIDCQITDNSVTGWAGGVGFCNGDIINCRISNNVSGAAGAGLYVCDANIINCVISDNINTGYYGDYGGGLAGCDGKISNCTIVGNIAQGVRGGGLSVCDGPITNCIIWGNVAPVGPQLYSSSDPNYSCVQDWAGGGIGNISVDPCFADPCNGDYHLLPQSLCIDSGDPNYVAEANEVDIDGDARVIGGRIDIGADEYAYGELSDFNGDGIVNFKDFSILAYYWMDYLCSEPDWCEGSDFDESRYVDFGDLKTFAENWLWQAIWYSQ